MGNLRWMVAFGLVACSGGEPYEGNGLALAFEEIEQPADLALVSDLEFLPGSNDFLMVDVRGGFAHMRLVPDEDRAEVVMQGAIPDVAVGGVAGLVGVAVDPDFDANRFFYVGMTDTPHTNVVRRYTLVDGDVEATLASGVDIFGLGVPGVSGWPHNVSAFGFDGSGAMWLFSGDKTDSEAAQDPADWRGTLLRILPSREEGVGGYTVPDNGPPIAEGADPAVIATGIRSPWRAQYHDGAWYFGDVGNNLVEEINVVPADPAEGRNFGWPEAEGPCRSGCRDFRDPWVTYSHGSDDPFVVDDFDASTRVSRSIYVGWIRQPASPDPYDGLWDDVLVFGDMYVGFVRAIELDRAGDESFHAGHLDLATAWGQAQDGYVYAATLGELPLGQAQAPSRLVRAVLAP